MKTGVRGTRVRAERFAADFAPIPLSPPRLRGKPTEAYDVDAGLSNVVAVGLAARYVVDRAHRSSVRGRERDSTSAADQQRPAQAPVFRWIEDITALALLPEALNVSPFYIDPQPADSLRPDAPENIA